MLHIKRALQMKYAAGVLAAFAVLSCATGGETAPRRLVISVAQGGLADTASTGAGVYGAPRVRVWDTRDVDETRVVQRVQALEGRSALVSTGRSIPVQERQVARSITNGRVVEHVVEGPIDYRSASTGFLVLPRLAGDRVTLEISAQREAFVPPQSGAVESQRVVTTVSGRLGEWIEVAALSEDTSRERDVVLGRAGLQRSVNRSVLLRVDEVR